MNSGNGNSNSPPEAIEAEQLKTALAELVAVFRSRGTRYALIGGLGVTVRGRMRFTRDIDVLLDVPQLELPRLLEDLAHRGFEFDLIPTIQAWSHGLVVMYWHGCIRVDWLRPVVSAF
ncbi:MAG TPA: hypothetical protein VK137_21195, partial [Planctomycetaceae bacterium]|nr:hypothetical protein [Planctomycetaceae bacterium]